MTTQKKLIQLKLGVLKLAEKLGNVSKACKVMGYSRDSFYRFQKLYEEGGEMALIFLPPYSPELNPAEKMWRYIKDRVSMVAYTSIEMLQQQLSITIRQIHADIVKSICGNHFYKQIFKCKFNV